MYWYISDYTFCLDAYYENKNPMERLPYLTYKEKLVGSTRKRTKELQKATWKPLLWIQSSVWDFINIHHSTTVITERFQAKILEGHWSLNSMKYTNNILHSHIASVAILSHGYVLHLCNKIKCITFNLVYKGFQHIVIFNNQKLSIIMLHHMQQLSLNLLEDPTFHNLTTLKHLYCYSFIFTLSMDPTFP